MATVHLLIPSFNAGELSPLLGARFAVEKVDAGCRRLRNMIIHPHGPAFRRPGMEDMGASMGAASKSNLRGFNFSTTTGAVLEFHPDGLQVWSGDVPVPLVNDVALPYSEAECRELQLAQVNDVIYLAHHAHDPARLVRYADDDWRLEPIVWKWPALGDENVRSAEIATPGSSVVLTRDTLEFPEFTVPAGDYTFDVKDGLSTAEVRFARLYRWTGAAWLQIQHFNCTGGFSTEFSGTLTGHFSTPQVCRMTYFSDTPKTTGDNVTTGWAGGGGGSSVLPIDIAQPDSLQPETVSAGEWRVNIDPGADPVVAGMKVLVQKLTGFLTWTTIKTLIPVTGQVVQWRGPTLLVDSSIRLKWQGRALVTGEMTIEELTFENSAEITLESDALSGNSHTLSAKKGSDAVAIFQAGHVGSYWQLAYRRQTSFVQLVSAEPVISAATSPSMLISGKWEVFSYGIWTATLFLERKIAGAWETVRSWSSRSDRNVIANGEEDEEVEMRLKITAGTSDSATGAAVPRFVLEASDAVVYGLVKITAVGSLDANGKTATATIDILRDLYSTDPTPLWTEGAWSGVKGFPRTVALHGQRLWWGGTETEPQRVWGSVVNDYQNMRRSSLDDAGVSFTPAAGTANPINWMASAGALVIGTSGDEWTIGADSDGIVTPTSVKMIRRSGYGSQYQRALLLGEVLVFVQRNGLKLRQVAPRTDNIVWSAADLTVLAEHVTQTSVVQVAIMNSPTTILWAVTAGGKLLGMTFEQEQNVFGWHVHETAGLVESVAVIYGADSDEVWVAVRRDLPSGTVQRRIERLDAAVFQRQFSAPARLMYVDAGKRVESDTPILQVTGLEHLEGREVSILGDGAEQRPARVAGGVVNLETPASTVIVGLAFESQLQPMRKELPLRDGTAQHRMWKSARIGISLHESLGGEVADSPGSKFEKINFRRASTPMDGAPPLFTGEVETGIDSTDREGVDVMIRQRAPLPLNIGSITWKGDIHGE